AEGRKARVIVGNAFDGARAHAPDQAQEAVLAPDAGVPTKWVFAEANAGNGRQKVTAKPLPPYALDEDGHPFIVIDQPMPPPVENGVGVQGAGIDAADGIEQAGQIFFLCALVGGEVTLVFA